MKYFPEYQWTCVITSIELFINNNSTFNNKNIKKVFIGDEEGYLHLMEIEYDVNQNEKFYEIKSVIIKKSTKTQNSYIKGINYNERLNIIITWSDKGVISINNVYSFAFLNIIDLGNNIEIKEILINKYDLLIVSYNEENSYKILCLTLNGVRVAFCEHKKKIVRCLSDEKVGIIFENGNILTHKCFDLYELDNPDKDLFSEYIANYEETNISKIYIKESVYYPCLERLLIIYSDNKISLQKMPKNFI